MKRLEVVIRSIYRQKPPRLPLGELIVEDAFIRQYTGKSHIDQATRAYVIRELGLDAVCLDKEEEISFLSRETDLFLFALVNGGFTKFMNDYSFKEAMTLIIQKPDYVSKIISREINNIEEKTRTLLQAGAHGVLIAEDIAYDQGPFASPQFFQKNVFPHLTEVVKRIKTPSTPVFFHSDGNLNLFLDDLVQMGFNGLQCLEKKAGMDIANIKKTHGAKLCFMGGIDIDLLTGNKTEEDIRQEAARVARHAGPGGGFIFGTNSGLFPGVSIKGLKALYEEFSSFG